MLWLRMNYWEAFNVAAVESIFEKMAFELRLEWREGILHAKIWSESFPAWAEALKWEQVGCVQGTERRSVNLEHNQ